MSRRSRSSARRASARPHQRPVQRLEAVRSWLAVPKAASQPMRGAMSEGMVTDPPMRKGLGSDSARIQRAPLLARAMRRPELGALSGVILIYAVFYATARTSGMFSVEGIVNILSVSAEIGIIASATTLLMIRVAVLRSPGPLL